MSLNLHILRITLKNSKAPSPSQCGTEYSIQPIFSMLILTKIFKMSLNYLNQTFSHSKQSLEVGFCFVLFWYQSSRLWPRGPAVRPSGRQTLNRSVTTGARTRNEWEGRTGFLSRLISQHTSARSRIKETHFK